MSSPAVGSENEELHEVIYTSLETEPFDTPSLERLLDRSRERNRPAGITGMLLYHEGEFLQVLEGPEQAVQDTFNRIAADPRHTNIQVIIRRPVVARSFDHWSMGFVRLDLPALASQPGFSDLLENQDPIATTLSRPTLAHRIIDGYRRLHR